MGAGRSGGDRGEQRRAEREQGHAVAGHSFGEQRQRARLGERLGDLARLAMDRAAILALDVERVVLVGEPAQQPVIADLGL